MAHLVLQTTLSQRDCQPKAFGDVFVGLRDQARDAGGRSGIADVLNILAALRPQVIIEDPLFENQRQTVHSESRFTCTNNRFSKNVDFFLKMS